MNSIRRINRPGFTLLELLVVMAILIGLFALLLPAMMARQEKSRINEATIKIKQFTENLELYATENRGYPTTEQGLMALLFIPDNIGMAGPGMMASPMVPQSTPTDMGTMGMGTSAFGSGEAMTTGPDMFAGAPGAAGTMATNPMGVPSAPGGMVDPMVGGMGGMAGSSGMVDPMGGGMGMGTGMTGAAMAAWNQPTYNPAVYAQGRRRPQPYVESDKDLLDPWGTPYRYENNRQYYGVNRTGTAKPAIWSAGPNQLDGDDDDICNWNAVEAQQLIAQRQQMGSLGGGAMGGMNPMQANPMNANPMDTMQTNPMGANPMNPMQTNPMGANPMVPTPMQPATPMQPVPMTPAGQMQPTPMAPTQSLPTPMGTGQMPAAPAPGPMPGGQSAPMPAPPVPM